MAIKILNCNIKGNCCTIIPNVLLILEDIYCTYTSCTVAFGLVPKSDTFSTPGNQNHSSGLAHVVLIKHIQLCGFRFNLQQHKSLIC